MREEDNAASDAEGFDETHVGNAFQIYLILVA